MSAEATARRGHRHTGRYALIVALVRECPGISTPEIHARVSPDAPYPNTRTALTYLRGRYIERHTSDGRAGWWPLEGAPELTTPPPTLTPAAVHALLDLAEAPEHPDALQRLALLVGAHNALRRTP